MWERGFGDLFSCLKNGCVRYVSEKDVTIRYFYGRCNYSFGLGSRRYTLFDFGWVR